MPFTITSPKATCQISGSYAIFNGPSHGGEGFYIYINYTKGSETALKISIESMDREVDSANYFQHVKADALYALTALFYTLAASGRYRIPITVSPFEQKLRLTFAETAGTPSGSIECDIRCGS